MILMAGARIDASEALSWGLVDRLAEPEALMQDATALTQNAAAASGEHVAAIKRMIP